MKQSYVGGYKCDTGVIEEGLPQELKAQESYQGFSSNLMFIWQLGYPPLKRSDQFGDVIFTILPINPR